MRAKLDALGYDLLCPDVTLDGLEYEDWWIDPDLVDPRIAEVYRTTEPTHCLRIAERIP